MLCVCHAVPFVNQDDVDADDGEDEDDDGPDVEGDEYLARLRKEALRLLKGEQHGMLHPPAV